ncbi:hypothetical protein FACS1894152_7080 [Bacilli bacterium]|nr:hypothetical protein FACS1894152_7080 [Bacilli bacterium]
MAKKLKAPIKHTKQDVADQPVPDKPIEIKNANVIATIDSGKYVLHRHRIPRAKFLNLYNIPKMWKRYLIVILIGIFASFELIFFVKSPGNYSSGIGALTQGIARLVYTVLDKFSVQNDKMS